jgi:LPS export ABC transporter protein LptC
MRQRPGIIIIVVAVAVVAGIIIYALARPRPEATPGGTPGTAAGGQGGAAGKAPEALPGEVSISGSSVTKTDRQGNPEWKLQAENKVQVKAGSNQAEAKNVKWSLLQGAQTEWLVNAPEIAIDYQSGRLVFSEGVQVQSADGSRRFSADRLTYQPDSKQLVGEGHARFAGEGALITGQRLVVDTTAHTVRVSGDVRAHVGK